MTSNALCLPILMIRELDRHLVYPFLSHYWAKSLCALEVRNKISREAFIRLKIVFTIFPSGDKNSGCIQLRLVTFGEGGHMWNCWEAQRVIMVDWWSPRKIMKWLDTRKNGGGKQNIVSGNERTGI